MLLKYFGTANNRILHTFVCLGKVMQKQQC